MTRVSSIAIAVAWVVAIAGALSAHDPASTQAAQGSSPKIELRLLAGQLDRGLPTSFTFVFVNRSGQQLRIPRPTQCMGGGTVMLRSKFKSLNTRGVPSGGGGGCVSGSEEIQKIFEWVKSWQSLDPGGSLSVSYSRKDLYNFQEDAGDYDFWGEYIPPKLTIKEVSLLESAGVRFPRVPLTSTHLHFKRLN